MFSFGKKKKIEQTTDTFIQTTLPQKEVPYSAITAEEMFETTMAPVMPPTVSMFSATATEQAVTEQIGSKEGQEVQKPKKRDFHIIGNDGNALFYHSKLQTVNEMATENLVEQSQVWVCSCGTHNYASFCAQCGRPRNDLRR